MIIGVECARDKMKSDVLNMKPINQELKINHDKCEKLRKDEYLYLDRYIFLL